MEFRKTPLTPDWIEVSRCGVVRSINRTITWQNRGSTQTRVIPGQILRQHLHTNGYLTISPRWQGKIHRQSVHRLVAAAWCEGYDVLKEVNHKDRCRTHNHADNLEWVTRLENLRHQWKTGMPVGEVHHRAKYSAVEIQDMRQRYAAGETQVSIAASYACKQGYVSNVIHGKVRADC